MQWASYHWLAHVMPSLETGSIYSGSRTNSDSFSLAQNISGTWGNGENELLSVLWKIAEKGS